jgi:hypothetical protein
MNRIKARAGRVLWWLYDRSVDFREEIGAYRGLALVVLILGVVSRVALDAGLYYLAGGAAVLSFEGLTLLVMIALTIRRGGRRA